MGYDKTGLDYSNRWLNYINTDRHAMAQHVSTMSNTKLKKMLYSLVNRHDKLAKRVRLIEECLPQPTPLPGQMWYTIAPRDQHHELEVIKDAIFAISNELADRKLINICSDTTDTNKKE
jgi:hypothetical protein